MSDEETPIEEPTPEQPKKKRGPRSNAQIEAEMEERVQAAVAAALEAERAKVAADSISDPDAAPIITEADPETPGAVTGHFLEDGFTILGKVWYRGEELTLVPGTPEWDQCIDKPTGLPLFLIDEDTQVRRWKKRYFREGPWRGEGFDLSDPELTDEERKVLAKAEEKRAQRDAAKMGPGVYRAGGVNKQSAGFPSVTARNSLQP